jgi:hypothetical protein
MIISVTARDEAAAKRALARRCRRGNDRQMNAEPQLRRGMGADANIAAEVYLRARHHAVPEIPPLAHPDDEVRQWMHRVLDEQEAWLAVADDGTLLGLMVLDGDWVEQPYMDPAWTGPRARHRQWPQDSRNDGREPGAN